METIIDLETSDERVAVTGFGPIERLRMYAIESLGLKHWARGSNFSRFNDARIQQQMLEIAKAHPKFAELFEQRGDRWFHKRTGQPILGPRTASAEGWETGQPFPEVMKRAIVVLATCLFAGCGPMPPEEASPTITVTEFDRGTIHTIKHDDHTFIVATAPSQNRVAISIIHHPACPMPHDNGGDQVNGGKYDDACTAARMTTNAQGVLLIGDKGSGFSAQLPGDLAVQIPAMLRDIARQIEEQSEARGLTGGAR